MSTSETNQAPRTPVPKVDWAAELVALGASKGLLASHRASNTRACLYLNHRTVQVGWRRATKTLPEGFYFDPQDYRALSWNGGKTPADALTEALEYFRKLARWQLEEAQKQLQLLGQGASLPTPTPPPDSLRARIETDLVKALTATSDPAIAHLVHAIRLLNRIER